MAKERMSWAELLDVLTDTDREKRIVVERATETERMALFLLRRAGWAAQIAPKTQKNYDLEASKPNVNLAVQVRNQRAKVHLGQIEKFLDFLAQSDSKDFTKDFLFQRAVLRIRFIRICAKKKTGICGSQFCAIIN
jgi:plasmid maintenance system antidote protein VapI